MSFQRNRALRRRRARRPIRMTYVITEPCIGNKDSSCVEVCPVDCIHPTPGEPGYAEVKMLFVDPDVCIDCGACVTACPVEAIMPETEVSAEASFWITRNAEYFVSASS
jgi:ferredoxin